MRRVWQVLLDVRSQMGRLPRRIWQVLLDVSAEMSGGPSWAVKLRLILMILWFLFALSLIGFVVGYYAFVFSPGKECPDWVRLGSSFSLVGFFANLIPWCFMVCFPYKCASNG